MTNDEFNEMMNERIRQIRELFGLPRAALAGTEPAGLNRPSDLRCLICGVRRCEHGPVCRSSGSLEAIGQAVMRVHGVTDVTIEPRDKWRRDSDDDGTAVRIRDAGRMLVTVRGGDRFEVWKAINDARSFGASFDLIHDGVTVCPYDTRQQPLRTASVAPHGLAACVAKTPERQPDCPECHGRGEVELLWSVSPCSRGCSK